MKPCQLSISICTIILFTAIYGEPAACYFDKEQGKIHDYQSGLYVVKDTLATVTRYQRLAHDLYDKGLFKRAIVQWKKVLYLQPTNGFAMFMLGKSYMGAGEQEKGKALCDKAILLGEKLVTTDKIICHSVEGF